MSNSQQELRDRIRDIRADDSKTPEEKTAAIRALMATPVRASPQLPAPNLAFECSHYPNKNCSRFKFACCGGVIDPCHRCHQARGTCTAAHVEVESIVCNVCEMEQSPAPVCAQCSIDFSRSFCPKCFIWTDAYMHHCDGCGLCRALSHPDATLYHCGTCNSCFASPIHRCARVDIREASCPVCLESAHDSQKEVTVVSCGHVIHTECLIDGLDQDNYRCPTCRKSMFDMTQTWSATRRLIASQPIPQGFFPVKVGEIVSSPHGYFYVTKMFKCIFNPGLTLCEGYYPTWSFPDDVESADVGRGIYPEKSLTNKRIRDIYCFDCENRGVAEFHFLGMECSVCRGFNTST